MKEHKKWLIETLTVEGAKKFELETSKVSTIDEALLTVSETSWRGALEMLSNKLKQITDPPNCRCLLSVQEIIDEELENGNS